MVDSVSGAGSAPGITNAGNKPSQNTASEKRVERVQESREADRVELSEEAQAAIAARAVSQSLENTDQSLGLDPEFDGAI